MSIKIYFFKEVLQMNYSIDFAPSIATFKTILISFVLSIVIPLILVYFLETKISNIVESKLLKAFIGIVSYVIAFALVWKVSIFVLTILF